MTNSKKVNESIYFYSKKEAPTKNDSHRKGTKDIRNLKLKEVRKINLENNVLYLWSKLY